MMKRTLLAIAIFTCISGFSQVNPNAIGLRGGRGNFGSGTELTYQKGLGDENRLELDLGLSSSSSHSHFIVTGIYHWVKNITSGLNWYVGPGAQLGSYRFKNNVIGDDGLTLAVGGQIGIEFDLNELDVPLLISIDTRPMWGFVGGGSGLNYGGNLAVRYTF